MASSFFISSGIAIVSLVYSVLILIIYLIKRRENNKKFYFYVLVSTIISMLIHILLCYLAVSESNYVVLFAKIRIYFLLAWELMLIYYLFIAFLTKEEYEKLSKGKLLIFVFLVLIIDLVLTIYLDVSFTRIDSSSPFLLSGTLYSYFDMWGIILFLSAAYNLIKYRKRNGSFTNKLFLIIVIFFLFSYMCNYFLNVFFDSESLLQSFLIIILYFSVESQDSSLLTEFNESTKKAQESDKLKSEFIMNMSHQLRTPMNTILGFSDLILSSDEFNEDSIIDDVKSINVSSIKLLNLINAILDISKIESGKEVLHNENYNLENIIYDVSSNINAKLKNNLIFTINADEICPNELIGDGYKLCKILNTIILNAINHTEYGEVSLNVTCIQIDSLNYEFTFLIKNSGHVMSYEDFNRSFEDLIKLSNDNRNNISAEVLNLIIAKNLLELIGGNIEFINESGKGTQYIIKLKQKLYGQNKLGNIREKIQSKHLLSHNILSLLGKKTLIIDDNKVNIVILQRLLEQYNIGVDTALNPNQGVELVGINSYDFIIINHNMSDISGDEVVKRLNSTGNRVPTTIGIINKANDVKDIYDYNLNSPVEFRDLNKIINTIFKGGEL